LPSLRFSYGASDPKETEYDPETGVFTAAEGDLRIWRFDGNVARDKNDANDAEDPGDYVAPGDYTLAQLGMQGAGVKTLYVEGITASDDPADQRITVEILPDALELSDCTFTDSILTTIIRMEFVTKAQDGSIVPQLFFFNCVPNPQIAVVSDSCSTAADGTVSVSISGVVTDAACDLVDDPEKQLATVSVYANSQLMDTIALQNTATPEYPWKPYNLEASFSTQFQLQTAGFGEYRAAIQTEKNVAGCSGTLLYDMRVDIRRDEQKYNIALSGDLDDQSPDAVLFYAGDDREGLESEILTETGANTLLFTGALFWADVEVEILSFDGLTEGVDEMTVKMKFTYSGGKYDEYEITFIEDEEEPESGHFIATIWEPIDGLELGGKLSLALPEAFDPQELDTVTCYMGDRDPEQDDFVLTENLPGSLEFNGNASWADVTVALVDFQALTTNIDTISTEWTFRYRDGSEDILEVDMTESDATSGRFYYDLGLVNIYTISAAYSATGPGTFLPAMIRIIAPEGVLEQESSISTFDSDWDLKRLDFGDGECEYVVDDEENAVVFLPAEYAQTHIQCKPISEEWDPILTINGKQVHLIIPEEVGLLVANDKVGDILVARLTNLDVPQGIDPNRFPRWLKGVPAYLYKPKEGTQLGHRDDTIETEIYWRFVGTPDAITIFSSRTAMVRDVSYRLAVIRAARTAPFSYGAANFNKKYWIDNWGKVKQGAASVAIGNTWKLPGQPGYYQYRMRCESAGTFVILHAAADTLADFDERVQDTPRANALVLFEDYYSSNGYSEKAVVALQPLSVEERTSWANQVNMHANSAKWVPGDAGYIKNTFPTPALGNEGENVIYLGASENEDRGLFTLDNAQFRENAYMWGLNPGARKRTLQQFIDYVDGLSANYPAVIGAKRRSLKDLQ